MAGSEEGFYHCISRVVDRRFIFGDDEREHFVRLMRRYEEFCDVQIVTFCIMSNHFHILVKVPRRPDAANLPDDEALVSLAKRADYSYDAATLAQNLERFRANGHDSAAEQLREKLFCRMWDVSWFMKMLKQRFSQWYNRRNKRRGTLWEERFRSVLVEGRGPTLAMMAAYIDLNPFRAGMVEEPAEYRWSGYGEATGCGGELARNGLGLAMEAALGSAVMPGQVLQEYRQYLFLAGEAERLSHEGVVLRRGLGADRLAEVLAKGGKLDLGDALFCRVRYFCEGVVLGSRAFVDEFFAANRSRFGAKRSSGARPLAGIDAPDIFSLRELREAVRSSRSD